MTNTEPNYKEQLITFFLAGHRNGIHNSTKKKKSKKLYLGNKFTDYGYSMKTKQLTNEISNLD